MQTSQEMLRLKMAAMVALGFIAFYVENMFIRVLVGVPILSALTTSVFIELMEKRYTPAKLGTVITGCISLMYSDTFWKNIPREFHPLYLCSVIILTFVNINVLYEFIYDTLKHTWWQRCICLFISPIIITIVSFYGPMIYEKGGYKAAIATLVMCIAFCSASLQVLSIMCKHVWHKHQCCRKKITNQIEVCVIGTSHHKPY